MDQPRTDEVERHIREHPILGPWQLQRVRSYRIAFSEVLEYRRALDPDKPLILVKHRLGIVPAARTADSLAREFRGLEALWDRAGQELEGTVPRPLAYLPEALAIALEKLPGKSLQTLLKRRANRATGIFAMAKFRGIAAQLGRWLRLFHRSTFEPAGTHDAEAYIATISKWLEHCRANGLEEGIARRVLDLASTASHRAESQLVPRAAFHGDLIPANILVNGDRIAIVDFGGYRTPEPIYNDLGFVLAYFGVMAQSPLYSHRLVQGMSRGFLEGYGEIESTELLNLYTLRGLLDILACQFEWGMKVPGQERKMRRLQHYLDLEARRLLAEPLTPAFAVATRIG